MQWPLRRTTMRSFWRMTRFALDTRLAPGERTPMHTHASSAALHVMSWSDFLRRDHEGKVVVDSCSWDRAPAVGEALWPPPLPAYSVENIGNAELRLIAIELKQS